VIAPALLEVGAGTLRPDLDEDTLFLTVPDAAGLQLRLLIGREVAAEKELAPGRSHVYFEHIGPGEYALEVWACDGSGREVWRQAYRRIGIGAVGAALGDSITEGYYGRGFQRPEHLHAGLFPRDAVSADGRNFPQFAPTSAVHLPEVNCFESWMTDLNDLLAGSWRMPVLIANEGWGGSSTAVYLDRMRTDRNWQERMRLLEPDLWLIHLGVNDERAGVPAAEFAANLEAIVRILLAEHGARARRILVARPCYDYAEGAEERLRAYCAEVDALVERRGLSPGPDLFAGYAQDRERWYGEDPAHPNVEGMAQMARLWHEAIRRALPAG